MKQLKRSDWQGQTMLYDNGKPHVAWIINLKTLTFVVLTVSCANYYFLFDVKPYKLHCLPRQRGL